MSSVENMDIMPRGSYAEEETPHPIPISAKPIAPGTYREEDITPGAKGTSSQKEVTTKDRIKVILAGKSGAGKSTLIKNVFGFDIDNKMSATSKTKVIKTRSVNKNGITIDIIDTVGFNMKNKKKQLKEMSKEAKGEADLVIYCLPIGPGFRFDDSNPDIMKLLTQGFGKDIWKHCMVVLTYSNLAWDSIILRQGAQADAITEYKDYIQEYVQEFKQELTSLKVKEVTVQTVFDPQPDLDPNNTADNIMFIPVGFKPEDQVLPGVQYTVTRQVADFYSNASLGSQEVQAETGATAIASQNTLETSEVITNNWEAVLVFLMLKRSKLECGLALLQFLYGSERLGKTLKRQRFNLAVGGGVTGGLVVGAVGAGTGAVLGVAGGPIGVPIGAALGLVTGIMIGALITGGGTAGISSAAAHTLYKEESPEEKQQKEGDAQEEDYVIL